MNFLLGPGLFSGAFAVSFRGCNNSPDASYGFLGDVALFWWPLHFRDGSVRCIDLKKSEEWHKNSRKKL